MKKLGTLEEEELVRDLLNERPLGAGSSRMVFKLPQNWAEKLGLDYEAENGYVVKVPKCIEGINQTQNEIYIYKEYEGKDEQDYLGTIEFIGHYISIMEGIEDMSDLFECADDYDLNEDEDIGAFLEECGDEDYEDTLREAIPLLRFLQNQNGSSDAGQIGYNSYGELKIYDYGFNTFQDELIGCSHIDCDNRVSVYMLIEGIARLLHGIAAVEKGKVIIKNNRYVVEAFKEMIDGIEAAINVISNNTFACGYLYGIKTELENLAIQETEESRARDAYYEFLANEYEEMAKNADELPF
jgi:hypothetical protein